MKCKSFLTIAILLTLLATPGFADGNKSADEKFYIFRSLAENSDVHGGVTFYAEEMSAKKAARKACLWIEAEVEMQRLAIVCPEPASDDDPQAFLRWKDDYMNKSEKLNKILNRFYAIKGNLRKITISGDEQSLLCILYAKFGTAIRSRIIYSEIVGTAANDQMEVTHCNFIRFSILHLDK